MLPDAPTPHSSPLLDAMNFIVSLAHFCEIHGPTSILCTQAIPPACATCFPLSITVPSPNSLHQSLVPGAQLASGNSQLLNPNARSGSSPNVSPRPSTSHHGGSANSSSASSSNLSSPMETPPPSPRSPVLTSSSLPAGAGGIGIGPGYLGGPANSGSMTPPPATSAMTDTCRSCSMTLPARLGEKLSGGSLASSPSTGARSPATSTKNNNPVLRSKEIIITSTPSVSDEDDNESLDRQLPSHIRRRRATIDPEHLSNSPSARSYFNSAPASDDEAVGGKSSTGFTHTHHITYLSTRAPSASRYSTLRQSCVRTLSCELIPAQTGPIMFGDPTAGYTIAYVFRLADSKARGARRSYALVYICPDQKIVVKSWKYVVAVFESLVHRIKLLAAKKAAEDAQVSPALSNSISSIASRGPEGFLRRRAPGEGGSQKGLAELVGREELFVEVHMCFVKLLGGLIRQYGCWVGSELGLGIGTGSDFVTPVMGRGRASSASSSVCDEKPEKKPVTSQTVTEGVESPGCGCKVKGTKVAFPATTASLASMAGHSVSESVSSRAAPSAPRTPTGKRGEESAHQRSRSAILIH